MLLIFLSYIRRKGTVELFWFEKKELIDIMYINIKRTGGYWR